MRRRQFVTTAGIVGVAAVAGCVETDDDNNVAATPLPDDRVDQPPHEPKRPPDDPDEWDDHWLGEGMATEPSLSFEQFAAPLDDRQLGGSPLPEHPEYAATLVSSDEELTEWVDIENAPDRLQSVDFDSELVVILESGYGSSSVGHAWQRVEDHDDGVYLHGYYTVPIVQTEDYTARHSVVVVERTAEEGDVAHVSLTTGEDTRVNFDSTEGVVSLE